LFILIDCCKFREFTNSGLGYDSRISVINESRDGFVEVKSMLDNRLWREFFTTIDILLREIRQLGLRVEAGRTTRLGQGVERVLARGIRWQRAYRKAGRKGRRAYREAGREGAQGVSVILPRRPDRLEN
jgi:intein/homing endonuclease